MSLPYSSKFISKRREPEKKRKSAKERDVVKKERLNSCRCFLLLLGLLPALLVDRYPC